MCQFNPEMHRLAYLDDMSEFEGLAGLPRWREWSGQSLRSLVRFVDAELAGDEQVRVHAGNVIVQLTPHHFASVRDLCEEARDSAADAACEAASDDVCGLGKEGDPSPAEVYRSWFSMYVRQTADTLGPIDRHALLVFAGLEKPTQETIQ